MVTFALSDWLIVVLVVLTPISVFAFLVQSLPRLSDSRRKTIMRRMVTLTALGLVAFDLVLVLIWLVREI